MERINNIQYLRGIAALAVVVYHLSLFNGRAFFPDILTGGVDLFFVISGYVIWLTATKQGVTPSGWWANRLIRIIPLYWIVLTIALLLSFIEVRNVPYIDEVIKSYLFVFYHDHNSNDFSPYFSAGWSLNYEILFYAIVGVSLILFQDNRNRLLFVATVIFVLVSLRTVANVSNAVQFRYTSPLMLEFLGGVCICAVQQHVAAKYLSREWPSWLLPNVFFGPLFWRLRPYLLFTFHRFCISFPEIMDLDLFTKVSRRY